jgi:SRSO17 transposase
LPGLPEALGAHLDRFSSCFVSCTRDVIPAFSGYVRGLFQSERANMLRMSEVNETDPQALQHMLTEGGVDWEGLGVQLARDTDALLGGADSVLLIDESGFAKKGKASAGVARQWNGRLGKVDNCQVGVFATLCRGEMASLIDARLYLPESWAEDPVRCRKAAIPPSARRYRPKSALALARVDTAVRRGVRFGYVGVDGGYGKEPAFLRELDRLGCRFVADVHGNQAVYLQDPAPHVPVWAGRGPRPCRLKAQVAPTRVDQWAAAQPPEAWQPLTLRVGEQGPLVAEYLHARVWVWDGAEAQPRLWHVLVRREVGASEVSHYCLSNAPVHTPWLALARVQAQRFFIEHSLREAKSECGLADYPVRRWDAWHHHMALVRLGTLFLVKQKVAGRQHWPMLSFNDLVTALAHRLPRRQLTAEDLADIIAKRHRLRRQASDSHAKRSMKALE